MALSLVVALVAWSPRAAGRDAVAGANDDDARTVAVVKGGGGGNEEGRSQAQVGTGEAGSIPNVTRPPSRAYRVSRPRHP